MTYHCGVDSSIARLIGAQPGPPRIECDTCGLWYVIEPRGAGACPPAWFINGRAPRGWRKRTGADGTEKHACPRCREKEVSP